MWSLMAQKVKVVNDTAMTWFSQKGDQTVLKDADWLILFLKILIYPWKIFGICLSEVVRTMFNI